MKKNQKGNLLLDGLIGMLICSILAVGVSLGLSSVFLNQAQLDAKNDAINQLKISIMNIGADNLCSGVKVPNVILRNKQSLSVEVDCSLQSVTIGQSNNSYNINVYKGVASVTSERYFGAPGTVSVEI